MRLQNWQETLYTCISYIIVNNICIEKYVHNRFYTGWLYIDENPEALYIETFHHNSIGTIWEKFKHELHESDIDTFAVESQNKYA